MNRIIKKIAAAAMSMTMLLTAPGVVSDRLSALAAASGTWPVDGIYTNITTEFDERRNQNDSSGYHNAIDIEADYAANIYAVYSGSCVAADWMDAYGYMIILQHPDLGVYTFYAHCSSVSVSAGEKVSAGDVIGAVGSTGNSYGNHLHFGICDTLMSGWPCKMYSDPMTYFTYTYKNGSAQPTTCECSESYAGTYTTKDVTDKLNIRSGHSANTSLLGTIPANAQFKVTKADGKWAHVEYNGISGCVSMEYIQKVATQTTAPQTTTAKATTTTKPAGCSCSTSYAGTYTTKGVTDGLNIRADHSTNSKILGSIPANAKFKVTKADGKWAHVEYNGISGCVSMEYIQKVATQTTAPQTTTAKATTTTKSAGCSCSTSYAGTYTTKGVYDALNIRADHSASSKLLGTIPANAKFKVTKADGKWAHVEYNGISGCVSMEYIQKVATQTTAPQTTTAKATTTTKSAGCSCSTSYAGTYTTKGVYDALNIRADHSASSKLLGTIPANAKFKVTKADGKWAHVEYNGISGCVSMEYIQKVATQTTAPQTTTAKATTTTKPAGCSCSTSYAGTYTTKGVYDVLNIRADHSASSKLLGTIPANAKFKVTKADGKWAHIEYNGISGCVSMEYIQKVATQTTAPQTTTAKATTTTKSAGCSCSTSYAGTYTTKGVYDVLNIRADHSASSKLLGTIPANAKFKVTKADGKWAHVEYNGISGCVSMEYIQKVASAKVVGDINADGVVTISDAVILEAYLLKKRTLTQEQYNAADLDGDNKVNVYDMVYMRKKLV